MLCPSCCTRKPPKRTPCEKPCAERRSTRLRTCTLLPTTAATLPRFSPFAPSHRHEENTDGRRLAQDDHGDRERRELRARSRRPPAADPLPPRRPRPDRQPH